MTVARASSSKAKDTDIDADEEALNARIDDGSGTLVTTLSRAASGDPCLAHDKIRQSLRLGLAGGVDLRDASSCSR
jgi:hypothetical protein